MSPRCGSGTPKAAVDRLSAEIKRALSDRGVIAKLEPQVLDPMYQTPEEFGKYLQAEYERMRNVVKLSGARIE